MIDDVYAITHEESGHAEVVSFYIRLSHRGLAKCSALQQLDGTLRSSHRRAIWSCLGRFILHTLIERSSCCVEIGIRFCFVHVQIPQEYQLSILTRARNVTSKGNGKLLRSSSRLGESPLTAMALSCLLLLTAMALSCLLLPTGMALSCFLLGADPVHRGRDLPTRRADLRSSRRHSQLPLHPS